MLFAVSLSALAKEVPVSRAKAGAERFMRQIAPSRTPQLQLIFESPRLTKSGLSAPEYFIFSDSRGGFVIAAGDDAVPEILGYSLEGGISSQRMPDNLRGWLDMWSSIVDGSRLEGAAPYKAPSPRRKGASKLLETAQWNQSNPFNLRCIEMEGKRVVTGCTATATAIVMRYHRWPDKGTGTLPSYKLADSQSGKSYTVPEVHLDTLYNWDMMPVAKYDGTWSQEQQIEVARLMRDVGVMIKSSYSSDGTGAFVSDIPAALVKHMFYDAGMTDDYKSLYDNVEDWVARLEDNIDRIGPVVYGAYPEDPSSAGHAFVLDGYDENDYFHINWGWGGNGDGYFVIPAFNDYTRGHHAILGMKKDAGGTAPDNLQIGNMGLSSPSVTFSQDVPFIVACRNVVNYSSSAFSGELAFARFDRYNKMVDLVSKATEVTIAPGNELQFSDSTCIITGPIKAGDYLRPVFHSSRTQEWTPLRYDHERMIIGKLFVGDTVFLEDIVSIAYSSSTGLLKVSFSNDAERELRTSAGVPVTSGVSDDGGIMTVDARQIPPATYILHLQRGSQVQDIRIVFGLKK